jgi:cellulose biosynthesis protein BcsQ
LVQALAENVAVPTVFVASPSGGTGKTTILATLGRCLAANGERILLAETSSLSLVPFYFGAHQLREGDLRSFPVSGPDARVDVLHCALGAPSSARSSLDRNEDALISSLCDAAARADRMLLDLGPADPEEILDVHSQSQIALISLVPDLNSVFGVMRIEESLRGPLEDEAGTLETFYVLNKFDSSLALHRSIQSRLRDELGDRLLRVTIRRSDAIPEALADGKTVIDHCPDAGVAEDFMELANWLWQKLPIGGTRGHK